MVGRHNVFDISLMVLIIPHFSPCSNQILSPDVPHSLRLQGILIGGLAIVFDRQQSYLLEDLQGEIKIDGKLPYRPNLAPPQKCSRQSRLPLLLLFKIL